MENLDVLNKIIVAERGARQMAAEAKAERENLSDELRSQRADIRASNLARAEKRVQVVREQEEAMTAQRIEQMDAALLEDLKRLEEYFGAHRCEMADELFSRVVGT